VQLHIVDALGLLFDARGRDDERQSLASGSRVAYLGKAPDNDSLISA
jgi:hypothetical protein